MAYVYALIDPSTLAIRYVGYTTGSPRKRLSKHISSCRRDFTYKGNWIRGLLNRGKRPLIRVLESNAKSTEEEMQWVDKCEHDGCRLLNMSWGGPGNLGYRHIKPGVPVVEVAPGVRHRAVRCKCKQCGKKFLASVHERRRNNGKFCSKKCSNTYTNRNSTRYIKDGEKFVQKRTQRYRAVESKCQECGTSFLIKKTDILQGYTPLCCSRKCNSIMWGRRSKEGVLYVIKGNVPRRAVKKTCEQCGEEYLEIASLAKRKPHFYLSLIHI